MGQRVAKGSHSVEALLIIGNPASFVERILLFMARRFEYHEELRQEYQGVRYGEKTTTLHRMPTSPSIVGRPI